MQTLFNVRYGKNWIYITLRLLIIVAFSVAFYTLVPRTVNSFDSIRDIAMPAAIGGVGMLLVGMVSAVRPLRVYAPLVIIPADWALVGAYITYAPVDNNLLYAALMSAILVSGILRLGTSLGTIQAIGVFVAALIGLFSRQGINIDTLLAAPLEYAPASIIALLMAILAAVWYNTLDEENNRKRKLVRQEIEESRQRLDDMRERAKAFADMAATLNSTLSYDTILDAAMDIGRLSIRHDPRERVISMALMVTNPTEMRIATARGIPHIDLDAVFEGKHGIIADSIHEGYPLIVDDGERDPELRRMRCFKNVRTTLCIPLRSNYETYGVLIFGSTAPGAINEDHTDTLAAIGTQAAIALHNAALYEDLRDEKDKLRRVEENGRKALVRDLHDVPTQTISAVAMRLSTIPMILDRYPERVRDEIEEIREMSLRASEELRHVMFTLRPLALESQGLGAALEQLCDKMQKTYKQRMELDMHANAERAIHQDAKGALFYLIEEAANNARKYAEADLIRVQVHLKGNEIVVKVRDNGKGFDMSRVSENYEDRGSFGMVNMRERAELANGRFDMHSAPGRGTVVTVRVPAAYVPDARRNGNGRRASAARETQPIPKERTALRNKERYSSPLSPSR